MKTVQRTLIFIILTVQCLFIASINPAECQTFKSQKISFVAYDATGMQIRNVTFALTVSLADSKNTSNVFYIENHFAQSDSAGLLTISIGEGKSVAGFVPETIPQSVEFLLRIEGIEIGAEKNRKIFVGFTFQPDHGAGRVVQNPKYKIGDNGEGGIIFNIDESGLHGKAVMEVDLDSKLPYGCPDLRVYSDSPVDGQVNTLLITKYCKEDAAASVCYRLKLGGYNNWYLPSISELEEIYRTLFYKGGFSTDYYWSSTECKECKYLSGWGVNFDNSGKKVTIDKDRSVHVRAIRTF